MLALAQRNIKLYFRNHTGVVMSLIGALISFFIYICFLQKNLSSSWNNVKNITPMLDAWMVGGNPSNYRDHNCLCCDGTTS